MLHRFFKVVIFFDFLCTIECSVDEFRLLQHLKENYDPFERPIENVSQPLQVKVRMLLNQILDIDEKNQQMAVLAYVDYRWSDYKMRWDPAKFGGITDIRIQSGEDAPVSEKFLSTYDSRFIVKHTGEVQQNPPAIFRFICQIDVTYYPFDSQTCFLKMGSWTHSGSLIDLDFFLANLTNPKGEIVNPAPIRSEKNPGSYYVDDCVDLQVYMKNGEWELMHTPGKRLVTLFDKEPYHELFFYIHVKRLTLAYETTVLLSVIFFLQIVSNVNPPQSQSLPILCHKLSLIQNTSRFYEQLREIHDDLQKLTNRMNDAMREEQQCCEWRFASMAVDRLCLYMFTIFIMLSTSALIVPHLIA
ncbi:hypothetical protein WR25_14913 [Diploscapter pachys]|uniref:Neurotransmitter-gated ion-channel ligand-binding domain-containing protein n=1 Tax=Diploscapter pachys TaxID=2018661 RepID=A0A2A2J2R1_9BILA|nr:hypothetical protein WR25_14913 [Diploscapter pachys]